MIRIRSSVQLFLVQSLVPIICSIALGFLFYQDGVFNRSHGSFQFVWSAVVASVFYYLLISIRFRDAMLGFILLLGLTFVTTGSTRTAYVLRDIFYVAAIGIAVYLYFKHFQKPTDGHFAYPAFMLAGIYGVVYIAASEFHLLLLQGFQLESTGGSAASVAASTAYFGVMIGFAVGLGIALSSVLFTKVARG
jgi:hypothetical protein